MTTFKNEKTNNIATVKVNNYGEFQVYFGYDNGTNDAYGNQTWTGRKVYKNEKMAIKKAQEYVA